MIIISENEGWLCTYSFVHKSEIGNCSCLGIYTQEYGVKVPSKNHDVLHEVLVGKTDRVNKKNINGSSSI